MQQDDYYQMEQHTKSNKQQIKQSIIINDNSFKKNIIQTHNNLQEGINYLVPSFWYHELIALNQQQKTLQNVLIPSVQVLIEVMNIYKIIHPIQSAFSIKEINQRSSSFLKYNFLQQNNYMTSKIIKYSKIDNLNHENQFQWKILNPFIFKFIQAKLSINNKSQRKINEQNKIFDCIQTQQRQQSKITNIQFPRMIVFISKQFILDKKCKFNQNISSSQSNNTIKLKFKNSIVHIPNHQINKQITYQMANMTQNQIKLFLIIQNNQKKHKFQHKIQINGYFYKKLGVKEFLTNVIEIQSFKNNVNTVKLYFYDKFGEIFTRKITTFEYLIQESQHNVLFVTTTPLQEICQFQNNVKKELNEFIEKEFNFPAEIKLNKAQILEQNIKFQQIQLTLKQKNIKQQFKQILTFLQRNPNEQKKIKNELGFSQRVVTISRNKVHYNSQIDLNSSQNNMNIYHGENNSDTRNLDSITTNFDTPQIQIQNTNSVCRTQKQQNINSRQYKNSKSRKNKSQRYLTKKRLKLVSRTKCPRVGTVANEHDLQYKKRIKHPVFKSLNNLEENNEELNSLLQNLRKLSIVRIYEQDKKLIPQPYNKQSYLQPSQRKNTKFGNKTQQKYNQKVIIEFKSQQSFYSGQCSFNQFDKQKILSPQLTPLQIHMTQSLQKIASQLEYPYYPHLNKQKQFQINKQLPMKIQLLSQEQKFLFTSKKDCQEIKTIIDNNSQNGNNNENGFYNENLFFCNEKANNHCHDSRSNGFQNKYQYQKEKAHNIKRQRTTKEKNSLNSQNVQNQKGYMSEGMGDFQDAQQTN